MWCQICIAQRFKIAAEKRELVDYGVSYRKLCRRNNSNYNGSFCRSEHNRNSFSSHRKKKRAVALMKAASRATSSVGERTLTRKFGCR